MTGLNITEYLKHTDDQGGGSGKWLKQWRKKLPGDVTIWLHTRAPIVSACNHPFMLEDEAVDKETGRAKQFLRYPRFVSPDSEVVHKNQYFREDDGTLQVLPDRDPFLLLREWLRFANDIPLDAAVFKWYDTKNRRDVIWERGVLTGDVKRGKANFQHSLDTKIEYVYVVVDNDAIEIGPVLAREGKLLSQQMADVIKQQRKLFGEEKGDPFQHPYAIVWTAEDTVPMKMYKAYKAEGVELSDEAWEAITSEEFPDNSVFGTTEDGDLEKIRAAFEAAAQIELPLDDIFSPDAATRRALCKPAGSGPRPTTAARPSRAAQTRGTVNPPPPAKKSATQPVVTQPAVGAPQTRRKKVAEPEPEPESERVKCEDCDFMMLPSDTLCEHCGAEYESLGGEEPPPQPPTKPKPVAAVAAKQKPETVPATTGKTASASASASAAAVKSKPAAVAKPKAVTKPAQQELPSVDAQGDLAECFACSADLHGAAICPSCGVEQGDDIPF